MRTSGLFGVRRNAGQNEAAGNSTLEGYRALDQIFGVSPQVPVDTLTFGGRDSHAARRTEIGNTAVLVRQNGASVNYCCLYRLRESLGLAAPNTARVRAALDRIRTRCFRKRAEKQQNTEDSNRAELFVTKTVR